MREESAKKVVDLLVPVLEGTIKNIPPYISNLLFRYSMYSLSLTLLWFIVIWFAFFFWYKASKAEEDDKMFPLIFVTVLTTIIGVVIIAHNIQWIFLPEVSLLENLKH